ncbi:MAG TPA: hypothetical protein VIU64_23430 [Polyangia bacterium]
MAHSHSHSSHSQEAAVGTQGMNLKKIILVGVASLVIFAVGIVWAYFILAGQRSAIQETTGRAGVAKELGKQEIGIVDQVLFSHDNRLELWKADRSKRLNSYGWIDRSKGVAHMPIEEAMKRVIASPPDIAGEGVPPKGAPVGAAPSAAAEDESKKEKGGHKSGKSIDHSPEKAKAEKAGGAP